MAVFGAVSFCATCSRSVSVLSGHDNAMVFEAGRTCLQVHQRFRHGTSSVDWPGGIYYPVLGSQGKAHDFLMVTFRLQTTLKLAVVLIYIATKKSTVNKRPDTDNQAPETNCLSPETDYFRPCPVCLFLFPSRTGS